MTEKRVIKVEFVENASVKQTFHADVAVFGAGPAGIMASISAARFGANVVLVEKMGFSGGTATAGLVTHLGGFHAHNSNQDIIGGIPVEFIDRLVQIGGAIRPEPAEKYNPWQGCIYFDPESYKLLADRMLTEAGVQVLYHTSACGLDMDDDRVKRVYLHSKAGLQLLHAASFIDTTGDGDLLNWSGLPVDNSVVQASTTIIRMGGVDHSKAKSVIETTPTRGFQETADEIYDRWGIRLPWGIGNMRSVNNGDHYFNVTRLLNVDALDNLSLSQAEIEGREQSHAIGEALRTYHPGFESAYIVQTSTALGIRCSSRLVGEYQLTEQDVLSCNVFEDTIAKGSWPIDVHNPQGEGTLLQFLPEGGSFSVPLRCLFNGSVDNLITAGRSISASVKAHGAARIQATAMATGQAAGVLGALIHQESKPATSINTSRVRNTLRTWGAVI